MWGGGRSWEWRHGRLWHNHKSVVLRNCDLYSPQHVMLMGDSKPVRQACQTLVSEMPSGPDYIATIPLSNAQGSHCTARVLCRLLAGIHSSTPHPLFKSTCEAPTSHRQLCVQQPPQTMNRNVIPKVPTNMSSTFTYDSSLGRDISCGDRPI